MIDGRRRPGINGKKINPDWQHSGAVDWDGNVYIIERDAHRIVKLNPKMDTFLMQLGTTMQKATTRRISTCRPESPSSRTATSSSPTAMATIAWCCSTRPASSSSRLARGRVDPTDKGTGPGEWKLPHKLAVDAQENLYIIDREGHRLQVFDKNLNYIREIRNEVESVGREHLTQGHRRGWFHRRSHAGARAQVLAEGRQAAGDVGNQGAGPDEFDWVHGIVVDSKGAVYAGDTYGQRMQKFVPAAGTF